MLRPDRVDSPGEHAIPKILHFIWVGSKIPERYLDHINTYCILANNSGFEVNLWTDTPMNIIHTQVHTNDNASALQYLHIRTLSELEHSGNNDLWKCIGREMIGQVNYAAAADILRLEILRQKGGYYFDLDLVPLREGEAGANKPLEIPPAPYGFLCYCEEWGDAALSNQSIEPSRIARLSNHALASTPNHPILQICLRNIVENYKSLDQNEDSKDITWGYMMSAKRSHISTMYGGRYRLAIEASGPTVIKVALCEYTKDKPIEDFSGLAFPLKGVDPMEEKNYESIIKMTDSAVFYDKSWLKESGVRLMSNLNGAQPSRQGIVYVSLRNGAIDYCVLDKNNAVKEGKITAEDLGFGINMPISNDLVQFAPIEEAILDLTSQRGHTVQKPKKAEGFEEPSRLPSSLFPPNRP